MGIIITGNDDNETATIRPRSNHFPGSGAIADNVRLSDNYGAEERVSLFRRKKRNRRETTTSASAKCVSSPRETATCDRFGNRSLS